MAKIRTAKISPGIREMEIKKKTPLLKGFAVIIIVILPILAISDFITGDTLFGYIEIGVMAMFALMFYLLRKGMYLPVSLVSSILVWLTLAFIGLSGEAKDPIAIYRVVVYLAAAVAFSSFFLINRTIPIVMAAANVPLILAFFLFIPHGSGSTGNSAIVSQVFHFLLVFMIIQPTRLGRSISAELEAEKHKGAEHLEVIEKSMERSEENLRSIGALAGQVDGIRSVVEAAAASFSVIGKRLAEVDRATDSATKEADSIGERMRYLNDHIESESAAQEESAASVNQMVASIGTVADSAKKRRNGMTDLIKTTEEGESRLSSLLATISQAQGSVDAIKQMVNVINKIASSTNLLAMNASIEAAHAGEAGQGFAVVAEEIRGLAENSSRNAKEIGQKLKDVVMVISEVSTQSGKMKESFGKIRQEVDQSISSFEEISTATGELAEGGRQILEAIKVLNDSSSNLREGGVAILSAQNRMIELQQTSKAEIGNVAAEVVTVEGRNASLLESAAEVARVAGAAAQHAEELHAAMSRGEGVQKA